MNDFSHIPANPPAADPVDVPAFWRNFAADLPQDKVMWSEIMPGGAHWSGVMPRGSDDRFGFSPSPSCT